MVYRYRCRASPQLDHKRRRTRRKVPTTPRTIRGKACAVDCLAPRASRLVALRARASPQASNLPEDQRRSTARVYPASRAQSRRARAHDQMARWRPVDSAILLLSSSSRTFDCTYDEWMIHQTFPHTNQTDIPHRTHRAPSAPSRPAPPGAAVSGGGRGRASPRGIIISLGTGAFCLIAAAAAAVVVHTTDSVDTRGQQSHWSVWTRMLHRASSQAGLRGRASEGLM